MPEQSVIYITPVVVPSSTAASKRILANAHLLKKLNYNVIICSGENNEKEPFNFEDITIVPTGNNIVKTRGIFKLLAYIKSTKNAMNYLNSFSENKIKALIIYSGYTPYIIRLQKWCKTNTIPLIFDVVEWYTPPNKLHWLINPYYWNTELAVRYFIPRLKNVISISEYLNRYYKKKQCNTVIIPPLYYVKNDTKNKYENKRTRIISYTGSPGKKDELNIVLEAILSFDITGEKLKFEIAGINKEQLLQYRAFKSRKLTTIPNCIKVYGIVTMEKAQQITKNADFSILLRKKNKTTQAGFPTKVVESLSFGTPIITNFTSDLEKYLIGGENAIVCKMFSIENLHSIFDEILSLNSESYLRMSNNALASANKYFYIDNYIKVLSSFIEKIK